jgi:hypothetical protein
MSLAKIFMVFIFIIFSNEIFAATENSIPFSNQNLILENLKENVERIDLARIVIIQKSVQAIIDNMADNLKTGRQEVTMQTMRLIQNLIIQYRFSKVFFGWIQPIPVTSIYTFNNEGDLNKLKSISEWLATTYGFDDSPYTQITANTFRQMQKLLQQLETLNIDNQLKKDLRDLWMPIGSTIAIAEQGDRPKAFEAAAPVIEKLRDLYPSFEQISSSNEGFNYIIELQGLTEFYAEFSQIP